MTDQTNVDIAIDYARGAEQNTITLTPRPECG